MSAKDVNKVVDELIAKQVVHAHQDDQVLDSCGDVMADMNARYSSMKNELEALELETDDLRCAYHQDTSTIEQLQDAVRRLLETASKGPGSLVVPSEP